MDGPRVRVLENGDEKALAELDGEIADAAEGALWSRALIEACRVAAPPSPGGADSPVTAATCPADATAAVWDQLA